MTAVAPIAQRGSNETGTIDGGSRSVTESCSIGFVRILALANVAFNNHRAAVF